MVVTPGSMVMEVMLARTGYQGMLVVVKSNMAPVPEMTRALVAAFSSQVMLSSLPVAPHRPVA